MNPPSSHAGGVFLPTACQIRAARAMLRLSVQEFARESGVAERTIRRIEAVYGVPNVRTESLLALQEYLTGLGFQLIPDDDPNGPGPGLRWNGYRARVAQS